ncbi:hypothetical protein EV126DRAFT_415219 [Verticillium dahliae]|nr:hypothetical protein EV126DRAFT_415219 [Verticillium dahliae]
MMRASSLLQVRRQACAGYPVPRHAGRGAACGRVMGSAHRLNSVVLLAADRRIEREYDEFETTASCHGVPSRPDDKIYMVEEHASSMLVFTSLSSNHSEIAMPSSHHPPSETDSPLRAHLERSSHWSHPYLSVMRHPGSHSRCNIMLMSAGSMPPGMCPTPDLRTRPKTRVSEATPEPHSSSCEKVDIHSRASIDARSGGRESVAIYQAPLGHAP